MLMYSVGCSDDYLNTSPTDSTGSTEIFENTTNAALALNGVLKLMTKQYGGSFGQGYNGEGTIKMYYGNYPGTAFVLNTAGWTNTVLGNHHTNTSSVLAVYPWFYYYRIIGDVNSIIAHIDGAKGAEGERQFIKAQALTLRAYAYSMLVQLYSLRWSDSQNGASPGVVLRLEPTIDPQALSTLGEVYSQVYKDLDHAINLFGSSGLKRRDNFSPDIQVAYAVYARAAINRLDYGKAADMAAKAREGYPLMTNAEYLSGFNTPNREWIWSSFSSTEETLYYFSFHSTIAFNSNANAVRQQPKGMSKQYYDTFGEKDIRRELFLDTVGYAKDVNKTTGRAATTTPLGRYVFDRYGNRSVPAMDPAAYIYAYMQFKFSCTANPGVGHLNHFRSAEMYLIEAEAQYHLGNEVKARSLLNELTRPRDADYTCTQTGEKLFTEIKRIAQLELWGEGFDWFMLKRWKDRIIHTEWGKPGGNYLETYRCDQSPNDKNNQTWAIPLAETDYNNLIDKP
jgi:hypothetical protein